MPTRESGTQGVETFSLDVKRVVSLWSIWRMGRKTGQKVKDRAPNKVIKHYAQPELEECDYLLLLNLYFSKLPTEVLGDETSLFYLSPKDRIPYKS